MSVVNSLSMDEAQTKEELQPVKKQLVSAKLIISATLAPALMSGLEKPQGTHGVLAQGKGCDT